MGVRVTCIYIKDKCDASSVDGFCNREHLPFECPDYVPGDGGRIDEPCKYYCPCEAMIHKTYKSVDYDSCEGLSIGNTFIERDHIKYLAMDYGDGEKIFIDEREG